MKSEWAKKKCACLAAMLLLQAHFLCQQNRGNFQECPVLSLYGSPARTRTTDMVINSHPLYRLSYWGIRINYLACIRLSVKTKNGSKSEGWAHMRLRLI